MIVHINPQDISQAIKRIVAIPPSRTPTPDDRHKVAKLELDASDRGIVMTVSNPTTYASVLCPGRVERDNSDKSVLVDCARFIRMATIAKDMILLSASKKEVKINSGGWEMSLTTSVKSIPEPAKNEFKNVLRAPAEKIFHAIRAVTPAASRTDARFHLTGMVIEFFGDRVYVVCSDGIRLSSARVPIRDMKGKPSRFIIPAKAANLVAMFLGSSEDLATIACDKNMVWAWNDSGFIVVNQLEGKFPQWTEFLKTDGYHFIKIARSDAIDAINRAALALDSAKQEGEISLGVNICIENGSLTASGESPVHGVSTWTTPVEQQSTDRLSFCLKYDTFLTALRSISDDMIFIGSKDEDSAVHIYGNTARWIIAPVKHVQVRD